MEIHDIDPQGARPQSHGGHRILDVTDIGHLGRTLLCLDCKTEFEEPPQWADRSWMNGPM